MRCLKWLTGGLIFALLPIWVHAHDGRAHLHPHGSESAIILGMVLVTVISLLIWSRYKS